MRIPPSARIAVRMGDTWIGPESDSYPSGGINAGRRGRVRFPDGKVRAVKLGIPDTFYTIPAHARVRGKFYAGYVSVDLARNEFTFRARGLTV